MKELLTRIIKAIVDNPEKVEVIETESHQTFLFEVKVAKPDIGKVIGKQGRNITAIRTIIIGAAAKLRKRVTLEIREDEAGLKMKDLKNVI